MDGKYARGTTVSVEKSQAEAQQILRRYGAKKFGVMEDEHSAYLMFEFKGMSIQISISLPNLARFQRTENGRSRTDRAAEEARAAAIRQRYRALILAVKAKLEAVECGISTIEKEFMAFIVMPNGQQLYDLLEPELQKMVETGVMPKLLLEGPR